MLRDKQAHDRLTFQIENGLVIRPRKERNFRLGTIPRNRVGLYQSSFVYFFKLIDPRTVIVAVTPYNYDFDTEIQRNDGRIALYRAQAFLPIRSFCFGGLSQRVENHELTVYTSLGNSRDIQRCTKQRLRCSRLLHNIETSYPGSFYNSSVKMKEGSVVIDKTFSIDVSKIRMIRTQNPHAQIEISAQSSSKILYFSVNFLRYHRNFRVSPSSRMYPFTGDFYVCEGANDFCIVFFSEDGRSSVLFRNKPAVFNVVNGVRAQFAAFVCEHTCPGVAMRYTDLVMSDEEIAMFNSRNQLSIDEIVENNNNGPNTRPQDLVVTHVNYARTAKNMWKIRVMYVDCHGQHHHPTDEDWNELVIVDGICRKANFYNGTYVSRLALNWAFPSWNFTKRRMVNVPPLLPAGLNVPAVGGFRT